MQLHGKYIRNISTKSRMGDLTSLTLSFPLARAADALNCYLLSWNSLLGTKHPDTSLKTIRLQMINHSCQG